MAVRKGQLGLLLLLLANYLALSLVAASTPGMCPDPASIEATIGGGGAKKDDIDDAAEEMIQMDSESSRRVLYVTRFLGYHVLKPDKIPCGRRGPSYYYCHSHRPVRPYTRGCSRFTRCGGRYR